MTAALLATTALLLAGALGNGPGVAEAAKSDCGSNRLCLWESGGYKGQRLEYGGSWSDCVNVASTWNDRITAIWNRLSVTVRLYEHANCRGTRGGFTPGASEDNLGGLWHLNNETTSILFNP